MLILELTYTDFHAKIEIFQPSLFIVFDLLQNSMHWAYLQKVESLIILKGMLIQSSNKAYLPCNIQ